MSWQDWQNTLDSEDMAAKRKMEKFWEKEKARLLADLEEGDHPAPSPAPPRRFGLFRRRGQDRGDDR